MTLTDSEQLQQVQNSLKPQYMESERTEEILREYQESRMRASQGMTNIVMGSAYGESLYALLLLRKIYKGYRIKLYKLHWLTITAM